jgi:autotransporter-associated beta strand protein
MTIRLVICTLIAVFLPRIASADIRVWDGGGADANWTTTQNWVGDLAPVPGQDSLEFPEGAARKANFNNFPASSLFLGIHFSGASAGYVLSGQSLLLGGTVTSSNTSGYNTITFAIGTAANAALATPASGGNLTVGQITLQADLALSGAGNINITGTMSSTGNVTKSGTGVVTLTAANTYTGSTTVLNGALMVNGVQSSSSVTMVGGLLGGVGTLGAVGAYSGAVSPGASTGILKTGSINLGPETVFKVELNGPGSGNSYDQLNVTGSVDLNGAVLDAVLGYVPENLSQFTIIANDGTDTVAGTFAGRPQGSSLTIGSRPFTISYSGGTGNDVVLTAAAISYIAGTVTNTIGTPVANASITIYSSMGSFADSTSTNAQGTYVSDALPSGSYFVTAQPPSSSFLLGELYDNVPCHNGNCNKTSGTPVVVTAPSGTLNVNFALPLGGVISGTVTNATTSAPVMNTSVWVYSVTGSFVTIVSTDAQGFFTTNIILPTGSYFLRALPPSSSGLLGQLYNGLPCADGNCTVTSGTPVAVTASSGTTANFALSSGGAISGIVTNAATGAVVPNASIVIYSSTGVPVNSVSTNAQGVYTSNTGLPAGTYFVKAQPPSSSGLLWQLFNNLPCPDGNCTVTNGTPVLVTVPSTTSVNLALAVGAAVTGTVTSGVTGAPVANASIYVHWSTGGFAAFASTNAQGVYTTTTGLPTGSYFVRAIPPFDSGLVGQLHSNVTCHDGDCQVTSGTPVPLTAPNATTIDFALPAGGRISGTMTNATTQAPVSNTYVQLYTSTGQSAAFAFTNEQGFYSSPTLAPGIYFAMANPSSTTGLVPQLYNNIACPGSMCPVLSGTPIEVTGPDPTPNINFALVQPPAATNDTFATAKVITALPYQDLVNTTTATTDVEDPAMSCGGANNTKSVWYRFTPAATGPVAFNTFGSSYDTVLAIYTGSPGGFTQIGCNDQFNGSQSSLTVQGIAGQPLTILVKAWSGNGGILALNVASVPGAFVRLSPAPSSTTAPSFATLSWSASTDAQSYEYCLDTNHNGSCGVPWIPVGNATSVVLTGLLPNTQYSWHVRAVNVGSTTYAEGSSTGFWNFTTRRSPLVDLNGDHRSDVFAHNPGPGAWQRSLSQADGSFATIAGGWNAGWSVVPAYFDTDALTDFLLVNPSSGEWMKLMTTGVGFTIQATGTWWPGWERYVMDLNGDGQSDVFLYDPATGTWFKSISTPTGFTYTQGGWNPGWEIYPMQLNADAFGDMFLINRTTGRWFWVLGAGDGSFTYPVSETWYPGWQLYPGDFNGDGVSDMLLHDPPTGTYFVATTGPSGFTYQQGGWSLGWTPWVVDLDADGKDDLFLHDPVTGVWFHMIGDGEGNFTNAGGQTWSLGWSLHPTDFNGDGRADFLLYDPASGAYYQARNLVNGTFSYSSGAWSPGLTVITRAPIR